MSETGPGDRDMTVPPPELVSSGKFEVLRKLGEGGMGAVWKAKHTFLDRLVAIKVMRSSSVGNAEARDRFLIEMRAGGKLNHPNIAGTIDAAQLGEVLFMVMEYVEGVSLDKLVKQKGPVPVRYACLFGSQAALGLQHAHERGMVHRDIKPANLMVTKDKLLKVLDFGLARLSQDQGGTRKTQFRTFMGTADYVAPEQAKDARSADIRSDIYSLGCTLYFLLSGKPPFQGETIYEVAAAHISEAPAPLKNIPADLWEVIARMMAKRPADRYQTPADVVQALEPFTTKWEVAEDPEPVTVSLPPPLPPLDAQIEENAPVQRWPIWLPIALGVPVVLATAATVAFLALKPDDKPVRAVAQTTAKLPADPETPPPGGPGPVVPGGGPGGPAIGFPGPGPGGPGTGFPGGGVGPMGGPASAAAGGPGGMAPPPTSVEPENGGPPMKEPDPPPPDGPDRTLERLDKAKADFQATGDNLKERLIQEIQAEEKLSKEKGYAKAAEQLTREREAFQSRGALPKMAAVKKPVADYTGGLARARRELESAYESAEREYRSAGQSEKADGVAGELQALRKAPRTARPTVSKAPVVIAEWEHVATTGKNRTTGRVRWYSNGRLNSPDSNATWWRRGNKVWYKWPNSAAPGGAWIDAVTLSPNGKSYDGRNNNPKAFTRIQGTKIE